MLRNKTTVFWVLLAAMLAATAATATSRETPVVAVVRKVGPAVVNIGSEFEVRTRVNPFMDFGNHPFFDSFFRDFFDQHPQRPKKRTSLGSGVIIDGKKGFILTNAHVVVRSATVTATLQDEREFTAAIVGIDPDTDLAVLRIATDEPLPSVKMGSSADLMIGETVIAIGNPFGFSHTVTTGVVSAVDRSIRTEDRVYHDFIQIDASINPGNSGGPLLNIDGDLIGINTAIYAKAQGIGFAIPIDTAAKIVSDLIKYGEVVPAWIGVDVQDLDSGLARYLAVGERPGVLVKSVEASGPALEAGLRAGDVIVSIEGLPTPTVADYRAAMKNYAEGDALNVHFWRDGRESRKTVTARLFPLSLADDLAFRTMGVRVEALAGGRAGESEPGGVVVSEVRRNSYLDHIGVVPGDVIRRIDDTAVRSPDDFRRAVARSRLKRSVLVLLFRQGQGYYITVNLS